jgi:hypothetical protein
MGVASLAWLFELGVDGVGSDYFQDLFWFVGGKITSHCYDRMSEKTT